MADFVQTRAAKRSTTHFLDIEKTTRSTYAIRFIDARGTGRYLTGEWSESHAATTERARMLIRDGAVKQRNR